MAVNPVEDFVRIRYTNFSEHTMDRPTRTWSGVPWGGGSGTFVNWLDEEIIASDMVISFVDKCLPLFKPETTFDSFEIFHVVTPGEPAIPVYAERLVGKVGTSADTSQSKTWERTYTFRTTGSFLAKICLLDTPCAGQVARVNSIPPLYPDNALITEFMLATNAWSGRANERPAFWKTLTTQPNQALENKYGLN